jgi:hypothetical protein
VFNCGRIRPNNFWRSRAPHAFVFGVKTVSVFLVEATNMTLTIREATPEDCLSINDIVKFCGTNGPEAMMQLDVAKQKINSKPCLALVVVGDCPEEIIQEFFQPNPGEVIHRVPASWRKSHVLKMLGCFESVSQAAKNGWNSDITPGFAELHVKHTKAKGVVCILKFDPSLTPCDDKP